MIYKKMYEDPVYDVMVRIAQHNLKRPKHTELNTHMRRDQEDRASYPLQSKYRRPDDL